MSKMKYGESRDGNYKFEVTECGLGTTKNGYPQAVLRLKATQYYAEDKELMDHFGLEEPGWVDWAEYDEEILAFCVLFKANVNDGEQCVPGENSIFWYEALQEALGWEGTSFDDLNDKTFVGKVVQGWVAEDEYDGNTRLQIKGLAEENAPLVRELKKLDSDKLKGLNSLLVGGKKTAPAKPAAKPSVPASKPKGKGKDKATAPPAAKPPKKDEEPEAPAELSDDITKVDAWNALMANKGGNDDNTVTEAFIAAMSEVSEENGDIGEDDFTGPQWAKVRDTAAKDLAIKIKA